MNHAIPRQNRFSEEDVAIKLPGYLFIQEFIEKKYKVKELSLAIDVDNNRMIKGDEFKQVIPQMFFNVFSDQDIEDITAFLIPVGELPIHDFEERIASLM